MTPINNYTQEELTKELDVYKRQVLFLPFSLPPARFVLHPSTAQLHLVLPSLAWDNTDDVSGTPLQQPSRTYPAKEP